MSRFKNKYRIPSARLRTWYYSQPGMYFITICTKNRIAFFGRIEDHEMQLNETGRIAEKCWSEINEHFTNVISGEFVIMPNHVHGIIIINVSPNDVETGHALPLRNDDDSFEKETGHAIPLQNNDDSFDQKTGHAIPLQNNDDSFDQKTGHAIPLRNDDDSFDQETGHALSLRNDDDPVIPETGDTPSQQKPNESPQHLRFRNQGKNTISAMVGSFKSAVTNSARKINPQFEWQTRFHDHIIRNYEEYIRISEYIKNNPANWKEDKFLK